MDKTDFKSLHKKIYQLAENKLGYPVSLLTTRHPLFSNELLGIKPKSLADILINQLGDPFTGNETWQMEVKAYEIKIIQTLSRYFGISEKLGRGYITTGGTEGTEASLRWTKHYLFNKIKKEYNLSLRQKNYLLKEIDNLQRNVEKIKLQKPTNDDSSYDIDTLLDLNLLHQRLLETLDKLKQMETPAIFCTKNYSHYSIYKIADAINCNIIDVAANPDGSMNTDDLYRQINEFCKLNPHTSIIIFLNAGTTMTGAIDNFPDVKKFLTQCEFKPNYSIHLDGALYGILLPLMKPFKHIKNYFSYVNTISLSFHKYLGISQPCGMALTTEAMLEPSNSKTIEYAGNISDITVSGSRAGLTVLMIYNVLINSLELHRTSNLLDRLLKNDITNAEYLYTRLVKILGEDNVQYIPGQFNIVIPKPSEGIIKKFQLMVQADKAVLCVMHNVNKVLIDRFIKALDAASRPERICNSYPPSCKKTYIDDRA